MPGEFDTDEVTKALLAKLYEQMTAQPDVGQGAMLDDRFIAWCVPGIPFRKEDFRFALRGIGGSLAGGGSSAGDGGDSDPEDDPDISAGEEVRQRAMDADNWARMANFIPDPDGVFGPDGQKKMYDTSAFDQDGSSIASIYKNVLEYSEVADMSLTEEEKEKVERFRNRLTTTKEEEDLMSGEMKEVTEASQLVKRYNEYRQKYIDAAMQYNAKRLNALNSEDSMAVQDWALNEDLYRDKVEGAYDQWVTAGYKNEVEQMRAFIDQTTRRNLNLLKDELLDRLDRTQLTNPVTNARFNWTSVVPARFAFADSWNGYKFSLTETETYKNRETNETSAAGGGFGIFVSGEHSERETEYESEIESFQLSCEVTQVMITRPWFSPEFMFSNAWRFGPDTPNLTNMTEQLSDGEDPPQGSMIAYPTAAIFVRNVTVRMSEFERESSTLRERIEGGAGGHIAGISFGGTHGESEYERETESRFESGALKIDGMQLLGFRCKLLPELPNPSDEVEEWA